MNFEELLQAIQQEYPDLTFKDSGHFYWNSNTKTIYFSAPKGSKDNSRSSNKLLHELAHAKLNHSNYLSDAELLRIESSAWSLAKELCKKYEVRFDKEEQNESLQSYISWASSRSQCPKCKKNGLQTAPTLFHCPNCSHKWNVGKSRFTRTYRH